MSNTWFIADPHFGHKNIIAYENRPYGSVAEMDEDIIDKWNSVVSKHDKIYILGDLSFYDNSRTAQIVAKLKGKKYLILGNHDKKNVQVYYNMGFHRVYDHPIILDDFWMLSHKPLYTNTNMPYANIFGHVHGNKAYTNYSLQSFCVSVERINYTPISLEQIKNMIKEKNLE